MLQDLADWKAEAHQRVLAILSAENRAEAAEQQLATLREALAAAMVSMGFATGHGETHEALLAELQWQVAERQQQLTSLRAVVQQIMDADPECACDHPSDDCCAVVYRKNPHPSLFCARCLLAAALATIPRTA